MNRFIYLAFICITSLTSLASTTQLIKPDFAYPAQVSGNAEKALTKALKKGDGKTIVRSLVDYSIAQSLIDNNTLPQSINKIETIATSEKDPCTKSLLYTLLADIYSEIYTANRWNYDKRDNPLSPLPNDIYTWDGKQFKHKITALCDSSLLHPDALKTTSLKEYSNLITQNALTLQFYPSLYDFVARHSINLLNRLAPTNNILPIRFLCSYNDYAQLKFTYTSPIAQRILSLYNNLLETNKNRPAAFIDCDIARIEFLHNAVYQGTTSSASNTFDIFKGLYEEYVDSEFSAEILIAAQQYSYNINSDKWLYCNTQSHISRFPYCYRINCLKNIITELSRATVNLSVQGTVIPNYPFEIAVENRNAQKINLKIYRLPDVCPLPYGFNAKNNLKSLHLVKTISVENDSVIPFTGKNSVKTSLDRPGAYIIVTEVNDDTTPQYTYYESIFCTELLLQLSSFSENYWATVVNPFSGIPVSDAKINTYSTNTKKSTQLGLTNESGRTNIPFGKNYNIYAVKDSCCTKTQSLYMNQTTERQSLHGSCYTSLPVYHPGDSVNWVAIAYKITGQERKLAANTGFSVEIIDSSHETRDTMSLFSDDWGRITGKFVIPTDGLTGIYRIRIGNNTYDSSITGSFTVSDYKLPTYMVRITDIITDRPHKGDITVNGITETYSGFPVAGSVVNAELSVGQRRTWWQNASEISFYSSSATTGNDGTFSIELPAEMIETSPIPNGIYTIKVTSESPNGETQETSKSFSPASTLFIEAMLNENIEISNPVSLDIRVLNIDGKPVNDTIEYTISQKDKTVHKGRLTSANTTVDWRHITSGRYDISFKTSGDKFSPEKTISNVCLYRNNDKIPPYETILWVPVTDYKLDAPNSKAPILYGSTADNCHIEYTVWSNEGIHSQGWLAPGKGNHILNIEYPDSVNDFTVTLRTVNNFTAKTENINISLKNSTPQLKLDIESFRDKITPGEIETWNFKITDNNGNSMKSAMIFDMYSKAIEKIKRPDWNFHTISPLSNVFAADAPHLPIRRYFTSNTPGKFLNCENSVIPEFNTYGQSFIRRRYAVNYSNMTIGKGNFKQFNTATVEESAEITLDAANNTPVTESISEVPNTDTDFSYREAETPLAFFCPSLSADDGQLTFSFTAPDANTTWSFNAIAYNNDLLSDILTFDIISNKPVMVQPNMPRFLRAGDNAEILASIMNNTDSIQSIHTVVETFDPSNGNVLNRWHHIDTIMNRQSAIVTTTVSVPYNTSILGYRIKSSNGKYSDGEQSVIAILKSTSNVIDTTPFYLGQKQHSYSTLVSDVPKDARIVLQFCENPTWYCITALPGLISYNDKSSINAMAAIFSAAIADGIIRSNPEISTALYQWKNSDRNDSTLVSMLERNQDLKTILLNSTPWSIDASNDTERMTQLTLLLDRNEMKTTCNNNIAVLSNLQRNGGGWAWFDSMDKSSIWCTMNILTMVGRLSQLGYLPKNDRLNDMVINAVKYIDEYYAREFTEYPKGDYSNYVFVRDYFKEIKQSTISRKIISATVQRLISDWKDKDVTGKAIAAIILNNNGYHSTARQILNSIREYALYSEGKGMWWPSLESSYISTIDKIEATSTILDAFHYVEPSCHDIDHIRQWIVLQKEATDWGTSAATCNIISSLLNTGSKWVSHSQGVSIQIGNQTVMPDNFERITGYFRHNLSPETYSDSKLSIYKPSSTPAWGAVYYQYIAQNNTIESTSCEAVSIERNIYRQIHTKNGHEWVKSDTLSLGDIVKIELSVKATQDLHYVVITDNRAACFEPVEQLPTPIFSEGICFYRENRDDRTNMFVNNLPKGTYLLSYEVYVNNVGNFASGIATIQSQYAPSLTAHSSGIRLAVKH